uniref:Transcription initiation factor IIF subunit alpha n=1 Tax=Chlamydomonas leiostraca TaxID=1034604 RepID=A0A7S0RZ74_9CHLO|mmetsp:Transcript_35916/g.90705  ORF Transcript_35916/g.90705 Transcript_35916/m.90705 type:complete len:591 (+) Transcript_35916:104-1876(+)
MAEASPPPQSGKGVQEFTIVPPGPIHRNKKMLLARFLHTQPKFGEAGAQWKMYPEKQAEPKSRVGVGSAIKQAPPPPNWLLERRGEVVQKGVPDLPMSAAAAAAQPAAASKPGGPQGLRPLGRAAGGSSGSTVASAAAAQAGTNYFVFIRAGSTITAYPVDCLLTFKPPPRRGTNTLTLEEAEAAMRGARAAEDSVSLSMVPKSVKEAAEKAAGDGKVDLAATIASLFGDDEGGEGGGGDDLGIALPGRKGTGARGKRGGGGGGRGGRRVRGADGAELDADEVAEDIYAGELDELRPTKPQPAEDWEHEEMVDDDDLHQGEEESEKLEDDPGERKKLGLEGSDEEEEEKKDEGEGEGNRRLNQLIKEDEEREEGEEDEGGEGADMSQDVTGLDAKYEDGDDDLDLDEMAQDLETGAPGGAKAGGKRKQAEAAAPQTKRARTATPPPAAAKAEVKPEVKKEPAAAAAAPKPAPAKPAPAARPAAAGASTGAKPAAPKAGGSTAAGTSTGARAAGASTGAKGAGSGMGPPTQAEIVAELKKAGGRTTMAHLGEVFRSRVPADHLPAFKRDILAVAKSEKMPDGKLHIVLKKA